jgi:hypothetical protein
MATEIEAGDFSRLDPAVQRLEFKVTVFPHEEPSVEGELRRTAVNPVRRKVYFYDTPKLALSANGLVLRARVTGDDDDDSTVKLRPLLLPDIPADWRATEDVRIEVDVVGSRQVPSAKLDGKPDRGEIEQVEQDKLKLSKLFNKAQEALIEARLPNGTKLDGLAVLGPVDARKWDLPAETFPHELSVEQWSLPDGTHFFELSFKVEPAGAAAAQQAFHAYLKDLKIGLEGDAEPKTPKVLRFFANRLLNGA